MKTHREILDSCKATLNHSQSNGIHVCSNCEYWITKHSFCQLYELPTEDENFCCNSFKRSFKKVE